jgi:hypothetical protein
LATSGQHGHPETTTLNRKKSFSFNVLLRLRNVRTTPPCQVEGLARLPRGNASRLIELGLLADTSKLHSIKPGA